MSIIKSVLLVWSLVPLRFLYSCFSFVFVSDVLIYILPIALDSAESSLKLLANLASAFSKVARTMPVVFLKSLERGAFMLICPRLQKKHQPTGQHLQKSQLSFSSNLRKTAGSVPATLENALASFSATLEKSVANWPAPLLNQRLTVTDYFRGIVHCLHISLGNVFRSSQAAERGVIKIEVIMTT